MTERLSSHQKRLLLRYQRLLMRWRTEPAQVSLNEVAEALYCSPRYARTLLSEMQQSGWLNWKARAGRGATGVLQCRVDPAALKALLDGDYAMQTDQTLISGPVYSADNDDGEGYVIPFFRPLMKITPSLYTAWPERHLIQMVHAGLMRFVPGAAGPVPGLAHTAEVSADGLSWTLYLRRGLVWHNGEPLRPEQLVSVLQRHVGGPGLPHVAQITLSGYVLQLKLTNPDVLLPHRLAHPAYSLSHPEDHTIGLGPFRIKEHTESALVLQRSAFWYGERPQVAKVSFNIHPRPAPDWSVITLKTAQLPVSSEDVKILSGDGGVTFLTYNSTRKTTTLAQQAVIRRIIQGHVQRMLMETTTIAECPEWLRGENSEVESADLPPQLNIVYCLLPELTTLIEQLKKSLRWRGCQLNVTTRAASHWLLPEEDWSSFDLCLGFQPMGAHLAGTLEEHYRHCHMFRAFWGKDFNERGEQILKRAVKGSPSQHSRRIRRLFCYLKHNGWVTPLYIQRWRLLVPEQVKGVETCELGWPDFTRLWMT